MNDSDHISPNQIAAYVDRGLSTQAREDAERHFDVCDQCRAEVSESARLADTLTPISADKPRPRRARQWLPVGISGAIAAAALLAFLVNPQRTSNATAVERGRDSGEGRTLIRGISPGVNAVTGAEGLVFRWHRSPAAVYKFTLLTQSGEPIFSTDTQDTLVSVPDSVVLISGQDYFWRVDGIENGVVSSTGVTRFHVK